MRCGGSWKMGVVLVAERERVCRRLRRIGCWMLREKCGVVIMAQGAMRCRVEQACSG